MNFGINIADTKRTSLFIPDININNIELWKGRLNHHYIVNDITKEEFDKLSIYILNESTHDIGVELLKKLIDEKSII